MGHTLRAALLRNEWRWSLGATKAQKSGMVRLGRQQGQLGKTNTPKTYASNNISNKI
ncbi:uncharacterized protein G2W53_030982 [Senna tora]|uniref:Uncharacterized protein n=1 Tax=Senna tora TaxID=362788 RepID=A0A834T6Z1_9FABA|nr:uncharacterized protein G2W53_030982 [Senna tora]